MKFASKIFTLIVCFLTIAVTIEAEENRIPFYEDYLKDSNAEGFLIDAKKFLDEKPDAIEAPRLTLDYLMVAKVSRKTESINDATSRLLFQYPKSLPTLHFISSFEKESKELSEMLIYKAASGDLSKKEFAVAYCRALILAARIRGPQFLANSSLRLRAHLLAEKAEVDEIKESAAKALKLEAEKNTNFAKVAKIIISDMKTTQKLTALQEYSDKDAAFATSFYLAQLSKDEKNVEEVILLELKQALFGKRKKIEKAIKSIASLPAKTAMQADIQTYLGTAQKLDGKPEIAIKTLSKIPTDSKNKIMASWGKTAQSFANGIQFEENRKKTLLEALGNAMEKMDGEKDSIFAKLSWQSNKSGENSKRTDAYIGISKEDKRMEIYVHQNKEIIFAYRTTGGRSNLYSTDLNQSISFNSPGVFPVPQFTIIRDIETGGFEYNFNLNFSSTQDKMLDEGNRFFESPYMGTAKGREIFLSYLLNEKPIWLSPAQTIKGGTSYPLSMLNSENPTPISIQLKTNLNKELTGFQIGSFSMNDLIIGDKKILEKLPAWPETKSMDAEKFDFSLLMKILQRISSLNQ